jgi:hypothetical protein
MTNKPNVPPPPQLEEWDRRIVALQAEVARLRADNKFLHERRGQLVIERDKLREALAKADEAINPPDRNGISLAIWNERLKETTVSIRAALAAPALSRELEPHAYVPSAMHMGDCQVCGHQQSAPIHK